ncbi:MAG: type II toxin-antitoxin system VapC family toxin [Fimbriimonadaceae bacterium]|nr:type II toxin-antitoxin system VapC family toxin [Fimbriimonadaceae bacterium]
MSPRKLLLDSCIFIALQKKDFDEATQSAITALFREIDKGEVFAVVPSLVISELLDGSYEEMMKLCDGRRATLVDVDPHIARLAREVRLKLIREKVPPTEPADSIYIATAIQYKCDHLVTTDGAGKRKASTLLGCAGAVMEHFKLSIVRPSDCIDQQTLGL